MATASRRANQPRWGRIEYQKSPAPALMVAANTPPKMTTRPHKFPGPLRSAASANATPTATRPPVKQPEYLARDGIPRWAPPRAEASATPPYVRHVTRRPDSQRVPGRYCGTGLSAVKITGVVPTEPARRTVKSRIICDSVDTPVEFGLVGRSGEATAAIRSAPEPFDRLHAAALRDDPLSCNPRHTRHEIAAVFGRTLGVRRALVDRGVPRADSSEVCSCHWHPT